MFWFVIILIVGGTYLVVQWGKKKVEQQGQGAAEQEAQGRPIQPLTQSPPIPYDPKQAATTAQLVGFIGRWTEGEANRILGGPVHQQIQYADGVPIHINSYAYMDRSRQRRLADLAFRDHDRTLISIGFRPSGLTADQVHQALGTDFQVQPVQGPLGKTISYSKLKVLFIVDGGSMVQQVIFPFGSDPAVLFSPSVVWPAGMPWMMGQLVATEALPR